MSNRMVNVAVFMSDNVRHFLFVVKTFILTAFYFDEESFKGRETYKRSALSRKDLSILFQILVMRDYRGLGAWGFSPPDYVPPR